MRRLYDVLDMADLTNAILNRLVRAQDHPDDPGLRILNYTELCAVTPGAWNRTTLACRGLIYRPGTLEVVARGFDKFFNYGQAGAPLIEPSASVVVSDKLDGSLGIIYPAPDGGWAVATRGSFASEQALHATQLLRTRYPDYRPQPDITTLVEIIYPGNRIVVDYAGMDDLVLIGGQPAYGRPIPPAAMAMISGWPGLVAHTMNAFTFGEALALPPRPNAEGIVVHDTVSGAMVKIKQDDYVALHKIITGLTARTVWEHMLTGRPIEEFLAKLPDEFHDWVLGTASAIDGRVFAEQGRLLSAFYEIVGRLPESFWDKIQDGITREDRKAFAAVVGDRLDKWAMFALLDGRDIEPELRKRARPEPYLTPAGARAAAEAAA
ncbi:2'-5' RNA ligase [Actinoplanes sp. TBRC 11911]|nr:2'-5' RNA ligase [Actinoplanes sp. TBRC 11911]